MLKRLFRKTSIQMIDHHAELAWVDEFICNVKPYIYVREEDNLLIKRPNNAQKLNPAGVKILKTLLDGTSIHTLLDEISSNPGKIRS